MEKTYGQWQTGGYQILKFFSSLYQCICNVQHHVKIGKNCGLYYWLRYIQNLEPSLKAIVTRYQRLHGAKSRLVQNLLTLQQFLTSTSRQLEGLSSHSLNENPLPRPSIETLLLDQQEQQVGLDFP